MADPRARLAAQRLRLLPVAAQRAALALVDAVTLMREPGAAHDAAAEVFTAEELDGLLWQPIAINAWNRQSVATHTRPEPATA
jgi:hypothetical protein